MPFNFAGYPNPGSFCAKMRFVYRQHKLAAYCPALGVIINRT